MPVLDFQSTYILMAIMEEVIPETFFFKDRYFPTEAGDIFNADKVLTEYRKGDRRMAAFVSSRIGDIPVERRGFEIHEYQPARIAPSRMLTIDELNKRGFGEAIYPGSNEAERAARLIRDDLQTLEQRIKRREEWMSAETMINNACTMQEYVDAKTKGDKLYVQFYEDTSDHVYTVANMWNSEQENFYGDVKQMCKMLSNRGLPTADLVLGTQSAEAVLDIPKVRELLDKNLTINFGEINQTIEYPGVTKMGTLNFGGHKLTLWEVDESYEDENGRNKLYFPADSAMVTFPKCGHMMYGRITQMNPQKEFVTIAAQRVTKFVADEDKETRKLRLSSRPLAAPKAYSPYIYAAKVVG